MAYLSPVGNDQQADANGNPLVGGKIFTYLAGSSTPAVTFTDAGGITPQANPIILNSLGLPSSPIWLSGGVSYKIIIKDAADVTLRTIDGVSGINDIATNAKEWTDSGFVATYISGTSFSVTGDQTAILQVNRRIRTKNTAGYVYGRITASVYASTITTVTVLNDSGALDSGLSNLSYGFLSFSPSSIPYALYAAAGANSDITSLTALSSVPTVISNSWATGTRQTVRSGPVDSNGFAAFGGSTGSTTVTASGTLYVTAANGILDRNGSITNPSWTGITANSWGTLTVAANGTCTTNVRTLKPIYQFGGTPSVTSGQLTFNIQEMKMYLGNGSTASEVYEVVIGKFTASGTVSAIVWYQLMRRYRSAITNTLPSAGTATNFNHNLGIDPEVILSKPQIWGKCLTTEQGYAVGDVIPLMTYVSGSAIPYESISFTGPETLRLQSGGTSTGWVLLPTPSGAGVLPATAANWSYFVSINPGW